MYELAINIYIFLIRLVAFFGNSKAKKWLEGRKNVFRKIQSAVPKNAPVIWVHCSSLGEFEQGRPVIEAIKSKYSGYKILLTFFSPSGYEVRKNYQGADYVFYLPADTRKNAGKFVQLLNIKLAIFVKYEFWKNYLKVLNRNNVPVILISAIFRPNQLFFRWYGKSYAKVLNYISYFFVQNEESAQLLKSLGINNVTVAGDTRLDRVYEIYKSGETDKKVAKFASGSEESLIVAGSTWEKDEEILTRYINSSAGMRMIIAPHEVHSEHIRKLINMLNVPYSIYTKEESSGKVLLIDTIGILNKAYRHAKIAYVGGGFGAGIHNILEAAVYGIPVIFGPNYKKFKEAHDLIDAGAAYSVSSYQEFTKVVEHLLSDSSFYNRSALAARKYVEESRGATVKIMNLISKILENGK